ncbi:IS21 family transposase [Dyella monticola]|uniref:IS21 family transposase n=1 Tax=Dyella monticola TaxID=1927958 RepID=A0A370X1L3_9GAMM|nr:IS21 family transposase [Dyella monticola]RDS82303.1 IS21 family transposase [Dyella monticola]
MTKLPQIVQLILTTQLNSSDIAQSIAASRTTVTRYRLITIEKKYLWADLKDLPDDELDRRFNKIPRRMVRRRMPDFAWVHNELQNPSVTLQLLWEEYSLADPSNALSYSQFTEHYRSYRKTIDRIMRQTHVSGEKAFVDFSGRKPGYTDIKTGEWIAVELFVGVLGASNLTYARCVPQQSLPYWIACHINMFAFFGGVPRLLVPDNLKSAISRPGRDFITNPTYREMAERYGTALLPTRTYKPRDKAKVEGGVLIVQRWILARLRHQNFFSLDELNTAVAVLVKELNHRSFKWLPGCRASRYEDMERSAMLPLPTHPYELGEWTGLMRVDNGYHILVHGHWYSVPHRLVGEHVGEIDGEHR